MPAWQACRSNPCSAKDLDARPQITRSELSGSFCTGTPACWRRWFEPSGRTFSWRISNSSATWVTPWTRAKPGWRRWISRSGRANTGDCCTPASEFEYPTGKQDGWPSNYWASRSGWTAWPVRRQAVPADEVQRPGKTKPQAKWLPEFQQVFSSFSLCLSQNSSNV
jgi:hypothetical protein